MSGFEVLRTLRVSKVRTPILILSGLAEIENKVRALGFGADDYMTKPFHKEELVARIRAIVRMERARAVGPQCWRSLRQSRRQGCHDRWCPRASYPQRIPNT